MILVILINQIDGEVNYYYKNSLLVKSSRVLLLFAFAYSPETERKEGRLNFSYRNSKEAVK